MDVDINDCHCSFGHIHETLLRETAKQRNVNLTSRLREWPGYSIAKERAKPISTTTGTRIVNPGGRGFLKSIQSIGGNNRDDFTRFNAVYFMRSKDEVSRYSSQYPAENHFTDVPWPVETVHTDDAAELKGGAFVDVCRERGIRQELTTADSPQFSSVVERGIAMNDRIGG